MTAKKLQDNNSDYVSNKVLTMFLLALIGVFMLMVVYRLLSHGSTFMYGLYIVKGFLAAGVAAVVYGIIRYPIERKNKQGGQKKIISNANIIVIGLILIFSALSLLNYDFTVSIKLLYILLPAFALLYLVFQTYPREFFSISVICATGAPFIWMLSHALTGDVAGKQPIYIIAAGLALMGLELLIVLKASKSRGTISLFHKKLALLSQGANLLPVFMAGFLVVVSLALSYLFGAVFAFYCMFAVFAYLFVTAVFYTAKLM